MSDQNNFMSNLGHHIVAIVILGVGVGGLILLSQLRETPASSAPEKLPPTVMTVPVKANTEGIELKVDGEVVPFRELSISAEVAGRVMSKSADCRSGRFVKKGSPLIAIDPRDYDLEIRRLNEALKQADDSLAEMAVQQRNNVLLAKIAQEDLDLQRKELKRTEALHKRRVASDSELDTVRRSELNARNMLQTLENQQRLLVAQGNRLLSEKESTDANLEKAKLDRQRTEIYAPIDGIIMEESVEQDSFVQRGALLFKIEDSSKVEVRFSLRLQRLRWLWSNSGTSEMADHDTYALPDLPVTVALFLGGQEFNWQGQLARYDGAGINASTRTVPCIAVVDDPRAVQVVGAGSKVENLPSPPRLFRGMFVAVKIRVRPTSQLLELPQTAIQPGNRIWLYREGKLAVERVQLVHADSDNALVFANNSVKVGDEVIVTPLTVAVDGMELRSRSDISAAESPKEASE